MKQIVLVILAIQTLSQSGRVLTFHIILLLDFIEWFLDFIEYYVTFFSICPEFQFMLLALEHSPSMFSRSVAVDVKHQHL